MTVATIASSIDRHIDLSDHFPVRKQGFLSSIGRKLGFKRSMSLTVQMADKNGDGAFVLSLRCPAGVQASVTNKDGSSKLAVESFNSRSVPFISKTPWVKIQAWEV